MIRQTRSVRTPAVHLLCAVVVAAMLLPATAEAACGEYQWWQFFTALDCLLVNSDVVEADLAAAQADIAELQADLTAAEAWIDTLEATVIANGDAIAVIEADYVSVADGYATEAYVDDSIAAVDHSPYLVLSDLAPYATQVWVDAQGYPSGLDLALVEDDVFGNSLAIGANASDIAANTAGIGANAAGVAANALGIASIDLSSYLTGADLAGYATETWVDSAIAAVDHSGYLVGADLAGYATETWVDSAIAAVDHSMYLVSADLAPYATQVWVDAQGFAAALDVVAIEADVIANGMAIGANQAAIGTNTSDIGLNVTGIAANADGIAANALEIDGIQAEYLVGADLAGLATESYVDNTVAAVDHSMYLLATDLAPYATQVWVEAQAYLASADLSALEADVDANTVAIGGHDLEIAAHDVSIGDLAADSGKNAADIAVNQLDISALQAAGYVSTTDLEAAVCQIEADAGLPQVLASTSTCTTDSYGVTSCTTCANTFDLSAGESITSSYTTFAWEIVSGAGTLGAVDSPWTTVTLTATPDDVAEIVTETVEVNLTTVDYCGDVSVDTVTVTLDCSS